MLSKNKDQQHLGDLELTLLDSTQSLHRSQLTIHSQDFSNRSSRNRPHQAPATIINRAQYREIFEKIPGIYYRQSLLADRAHSPIAIHRSKLRNFQIVDLAWQSTLTIEHLPVDSAYIIYLPCSGAISADPNTQMTTIATLVNPKRAFSGTTTECGQAFAIAIERHAVEEVLAKLLNRSPKQPLIFADRIDLSADFGASLIEFVRFLESLGREANISAPFMQDELARALLTCLLKGVPHNYDDEILYRDSGAAAYYAIEARSFIESHLNEDLTLADIAAAAGASPRLLQKAFAQHCGCSPMRYVKQTRLERIRAELERANVNTRIIDVMMSYGITQGGKFAKEYQQSFGEKPSDTLKRASLIDRDRPQLWEEIDDLQSERVVGGVLRKIGEVACMPPLVGDIALWSGYLRSIGIGLTDRLLLCAQLD